jgi:hypothetical protein
MPQIEIITVEGRRKVELGDAPKTIGRSKICQCRVNDKALSREHMEFRKKADGYWVKDLGSRNATFVNGLKVTAEMQLKSGDRITAGRTVILYDPSPAQSAAAAPLGASPPKPPAPSGPPAPAPAAAAPASPGAAASAPPAAAAGEGTAPIPGGTAGESESAWRSWLLITAILGGAFIIGLLIWYLSS